MWNFSTFLGDKHVLVEILQPPSPGKPRGGCGSSDSSGTTAAGSMLPSCNSFFFFSTPQWQTESMHEPRATSLPSAQQPHSHELHSQKNKGKRVRFHAWSHPSALSHCIATSLLVNSHCYCDKDDHSTFTFHSITELFFYWQLKYAACQRQSTSGP